MRSPVAWTVLLLAFALPGCSERADVTREELVAVVEHDGVAFAGARIPDQVVERLAANRVVVLGETHHLREHWALIANLLRELHAHGFRQLLVEQPQMVDWLLDDYATGGRLEPNWRPPAHLLRKFAAIRELNATFPPADRIHVRSIDVNEEYYGGAPAFRSLLELAVGHLPRAGPLDAFLQADYGTPEAQSRAVDALSTGLHVDREKLAASWGARWYGRLAEMVEVERVSIAIRADRQTDDSKASREREDVIKELADSRIGGYPHGTVINIGGTHAQKARLKGTKTEWLGDYLVHRSTAIDGTVFVVVVGSAKTTLEPGALGTPFDVFDTSPEHELFRVLAEIWPDRTVFLPLDDRVFTDHRVAVNFEETIYVASLKEHYDAALQYGLAHRMPAD